jgi:hypothetical protein
MSVDLHPHYLYDEQGKPKLVLLSYDEYVAMVEELEDQIDSRILAERVTNAGTPIPLEDLIAQLEGK